MLSEINKKYFKPSLSKIASYKKRSLKAEEKQVERILEALTVRMSSLNGALIF